jgi:cytochrome c oxidase cbb3-type subunit III
MKRYFNAVLMTAILVLGFTTLLAQDGESLFKAKCSTCHNLEKNSTGPMLQGVKQKWEEAGEGQLLYDWVKNSEALIAAGNSEMAKKIKDYSPTPMTAQEVGPADVDAILAYVDGYVKPVDAVTPPTAGSPEVPVTYVPNYKQNLTLFWWLFATSILLLFAIFMLSGSVRTLVNSDILKQKLIEREKENSLKNILLLIGFFGLMAASNVASAFTFNGPGKAEEGAPWLLIENSDLYILIAINLVLVGVLIYIRGLFKEFMNIISPPKPKVVEEKAISKKLNKILTDVVEIEDEASILMDHEYDGIQELDNNLPPWWVWMFYATIISGVIYMFHYHVFRTGDLQESAYKKEMAASQKEIDAYLSKMAMNVDETSASLMTDAGDLSAGKAVFEINCVTCHNAKGEGNIGPNLTDKFWLYGNDVKDVFKIIKYGNNSKGMPDHATKLNPIQIQQAASFVLSLPYTDGKEPQGTEVKEE